jgi:putative inorganic carbon (HCO3(-)) transporter
VGSVGRAANLPFQSATRETPHSSDPISPANWTGPLLLAGSLFALTYIGGALSTVSLQLFLVFVATTVAAFFALFLERPAYIVPTLVVTIPLEIWKAFFPFWRVDARPDLPPASLIDLSRLLLLAALAAIACSALLRRRTGIIRHNAVRWAVILLTFSALSAVVITPSPTRGHIETLRLATHVGVLIVTCRLLTSTRRIELALQALVVCVLGLSCIALIQFVAAAVGLSAGGLAGFRATATVFDPNILARYLAIGIVVSTMLLTGGRMTRGVLITTVVAACVSVLLTLSRTGWLLVLLGCAMVWWWSKGLARRRVALACAVLLGGMWVVSASLPAVSSRFGTLALGLGALGSRVALIDTGIRIFRDHLLLGAGLGSFQAVALAQYPAYLPFGGTYVTLSHTALVTIAAELGLAGLSLTTFLLIALFRSFSSSTRSATPATRSYAVSAFMAVVLILVSAQAEGRLFEDPMFWIFAGVLVSIERGVGVGGPAPNREQQQPVTTLPPP